MRKLLERVEGQELLTKIEKCIFRRYFLFDQSSLEAWFSQCSPSIYSLTIIWCYRLNFVPPQNLHVEVLTASTSEYDRIWRQGLQRND